MNNAVTLLLDSLRSLIPGVQYKIDAPAEGVEGAWLVYVSLDGHEVVLCWDPQAECPWQLSSSLESDYTEKFDELYRDEWRAVVRIAYLLAFKKGTTPTALSLSALREGLGLSQQEVGQRLAVQQAAISKLENRDNPGLDAIWRYIAALGGEPELRARVAGREFVLLPLVLVREAERMIAQVNETTASPLDRQRAAEFLKRTLPGLRELAGRLDASDLERRAELAIQRAIA